MFKEIEEFLVQVDHIPYKQKPDSKEMASIKARTQGNEPKSLTAEQLVDFIEQGCSISPAVLKGGLKAENWIQQQLFFIDIDNNNKKVPPMLICEAIEICINNEIEPLLYYESYSHTDSNPKFRLVFAMDEPIFEEWKRKIIIETLISLFPQADTSCTNADRIFFGTNKGCTFYEY